MIDALTNEHYRFHFGVGKIFRTLHRLRWPIKYELARKVVNECQICARLRPIVPRGPLGQFAYSFQRGEVIYIDTIGPVIPGKGGQKYIVSIIDSATRIAEAIMWKKVNSKSIIRSLKKWISIRGKMKIIMSDNASYFAPERFRFGIKIMISNKDFAHHTIIRK